MSALLRFFKVRIKAQTDSHSSRPKAKQINQPRRAPATVEMRSRCQQEKVRSRRRQEKVHELNSPLMGDITIKWDAGPHPRTCEGSIITLPNDKVAEPRPQTSEGLVRTFDLPLTSSLPIKRAASVRQSRYDFSSVTSRQASSHIQRSRIENQFEFPRSCPPLPPRPKPASSNTSSPSRYEATLSTGSNNSSVTSFSESLLPLAPESPLTLTRKARLQSKICGAGTSRFDWKPSKDTTIMIDFAMSQLKQQGNMRLKPRRIEGIKP